MHYFEDYIKDLKRQYKRLSRFYYDSCSEWLKPSIKSCLDSIKKEIENYENRLAILKLKELEEFKKKQITIYDLGGF